MSDSRGPASRRMRDDRGPQGTVFVPLDALPTGVEHPAFRVSSDDPVLVVLEGPNAGEVFVLDRERVRVGRRAGDADWILDAEGVSFLHALLARHDGDWQIVDALSTNGVFVNDRRVSETILRDGDEIRLGSVRLRFYTADPERLAARRRQRRARWTVMGALSLVVLLGVVLAWWGL